MPKDKRERLIKVYLTIAEYDKLVALSTSLNASLSEYARLKLLKDNSDPFGKVITLELRRLKADAARLGNLFKLAVERKEVFEGQYGVSLLNKIQELTTELADLKQKMAELLTKLEAHLQ